MKGNSATLWHAVAALATPDGSPPSVDVFAATIAPLALDDRVAVMNALTALRRVACPGMRNVTAAAVAGVSEAPRPVVRRQLGFSDGADYFGRHGAGRKRPQKGGWIAVDFPDNGSMSTVGTGWTD